ncbi:MAG: hypothetical protein AB1646_25815 [Thermodesulfobacteriota bacterium]
MPRLLDLLQHDLRQVVRDIDDDLGKIDSEIGTVTARVERDLEELIKDCSAHVRIDPEEIRRRYRPSLIESRRRSLEEARDQLNELKSEILEQIFSQSYEARRFGQSPSL